jgi:hypothetical protein
MFRQSGRPEKRCRYAACVEGLVRPNATGSGGFVGRHSAYGHGAVFPEYLALDDPALASDEFGEERYTHRNDRIAHRFASVIEPEKARRCAEQQKTASAELTADSDFGSGDPAAPISSSTCS